MSLGVEACRAGSSYPGHVGTRRCTRGYWANVYVNYHVTDVEEAVCASHEFGKGH
jgi:hypothetical protein